MIGAFYFRVTFNSPQCIISGFCNMTPINKCTSKILSYKTYVQFFFSNENESFAFLRLIRIIPCAFKSAEHGFPSTTQRCVCVCQLVGWFCFVLFFFGISAVYVGRLYDCMMDMLLHNAISSTSRPLIQKLNYYTSIVNYIYLDSIQLFLVSIRTVQNTTKLRRKKHYL